MAMKKAKPMVAKRIADRKAFVASQTSMPKRPGADGADSSMASNAAAKKAARQKFFVQTRAKELAAKGITVDAAKRKELRQKFQSGNVSRAGFGAPKKKAASSTSSSSVTTPKVTSKMTPRTDSRGSTGFGKTTLKPSYGKGSPNYLSNPAQRIRSRDTTLRGSTNPYNKSQKERGQGKKK